MVVALLPSAVLQFSDANGKPYAAGTLATLIPGTGTNKATWTEPTGTSLNDNPILLDSAGRCIVYGDGAYRLRLFDADGNLIWDQPSSTLVSTAMAPVVIAATLADARQAMGITDAIAAEATARSTADTAETTRAEAAEAALAADIATIALTPGPTGPAGPAGGSGGATVQIGGATSDAGGNVTVTFPVAFSSVPFVVANTASISWWVNVTGITNTGFTAVVSSPLVGGNWRSGPVGIGWMASTAS